LLDAEIKV